MPRGHDFVIVGALLALLLTEPKARGDEPARHVVKTGDTCAAIAQLYYGDARLVDLLHAANPALFATMPPHVLREGSVLVIPPRPTSSGAESPDAKLATVRNHVEVAAPEVKQGKPNDPLYRGNRVSTQEQSAADVTFRDESLVRLGERTLVIIFGDVNRAARAPTETQATLVTGDLRAWMSGAHQGSVSNVQTKAANVRILAGEAKVSDDDAHTTRLAVHSGSSTIEAQTRRVEVARGFGSKAELGRPPTAPRPLPAAPTWTTFPASVLHDDGTPYAIVGEYDSTHPPRPPISTWHVQIARDVNYRDVLVDTKPPASVRRVELRTPGPGHYYVRVSAIDDDHFEGSFGRSAAVLVVRGNISTGAGRRRFELEPPDAACMRVGNAPLTWVKGPFDLKPNEPVFLRCAAFETEPTTLLRF